VECIVVQRRATPNAQWDCVNEETAKLQVGVNVVQTAGYLDATLRTNQREQVTGYEINGGQHIIITC
jgi:hypothetical protein